MKEYLRNNKFGAISLGLILLTIIVVIIRVINIIMDQLRKNKKVNNLNMYIIGKTILLYESSIYAILGLFVFSSYRMFMIVPWCSSWSYIHVPVTKSP